MWPPSRCGLYGNSFNIVLGYSAAGRGETGTGTGTETGTWTGAGCEPLLLPVMPDVMTGAHRIKGSGGNIKTFRIF
jgi:hypothetical protein